MSSALLVTPRGRPAPPQAIESRLRAVSPRLSLCWIDTGGGCWAIMLQWSEVDRRRETVRDGRTQEEDARDVLAYLPRDCSVDEAHSYFLKACQRGDGGVSGAEVHELLNRVHAWNDAQHLRNAEATMAYAEEIAPTFAKSIAEETGHTSIRVPQRSGHKPKHVLPPDRAPGEL